MRAAGDPDLKLYGIFGYPLGHTISPAIQNSAFRFYGLKSIYFAFECPPARFRFLMRHLRLLVLDGFNLTVPYKEAVIPYLDHLSREAKTIGAVNTVAKEGGRWIGYNTDAYGFLQGLRETGFKVRGKSAVILGAGGSARAVSFALGQSGVRTVVIANRRRARARQLARQFRVLFPRTRWSNSDLRSRAFVQAVSQAGLIVNATKVGLRKKDRSLIPKKWFPRHRILVYDLIYNPRRTDLLRIARFKGHQIQNGERMLLYQAAKAFEIWTGKRAPIREMKKALHDALHSR